jgi:N6-adenosine-specific RNA methylase IME4
MKQMTPFPPGPFDLIYADPAWQFNNAANTKKQWGGAEAHYRTMSVAELRALPVPSICAKDCFLAMWWVPAMPEEALTVMKAWGFRLVTMKGFTWHKITVNGKDHFGMGSTTRGNTEDCLFAVKGRPKRVGKGVRQLIHARVREHSRKPDEARDRLIQLLGDTRRIELFARQHHAGWEAWGNEMP